MPPSQPPRLSTASMNSSIGEPTPLALREQRAEQMGAAQCSSKRYNRNTQMDSRMILTKTPATKNKHKAPSLLTPQQNLVVEKGAMKIWRTTKNQMAVKLVVRFQANSQK